MMVLEFRRSIFDVISFPSIAGLYMRASYRESLYACSKVIFGRRHRNRPA